MSLLLGTARADITPDHPVELAGFGNRHGVFDGVQSPLEVQAFAFGELGGDARSPRAILVCADLIWWGPDLASTLRADIGRCLGIDPHAVVLHASHTHGGPMTSTMFSPVVGRSDSGYLDALRATVLDTAERAGAQLEHVDLHRGVASAAIGMNRRRRNDDGTFLGPDPDGTVDREVVTLRFVRSDESTSALLVHFACHPSTMWNRQVSADFPGAMRRSLYNRLHTDLTIAYMQGCAGDVRVALTEGDEFREGTPEDIARMGTVLADAVSEALINEWHVPTNDMKVWESTTGLSLVNPSSADLERLLATDVWGEWASLMLRHPERLSPTIPLHLSVLKLGDDLALLGFDAEVCVEYGLYLKAVYGGRVLPLTCCNGMIGYVVTERQLHEGGYEPNESYTFVYRPGRFANTVEDQVRQGVQEALRIGDG